MILKTIGISELRRSLQTFLDEVTHKKTPIILTHGKHRHAALITYEDFLNYQELLESVNILNFHERRARLAQMATSFGDE